MPALELSGLPENVGHGAQRSVRSAGQPGTGRERLAQPAVLDEPADEADAPGVECELTDSTIADALPELHQPFDLLWGAAGAPELQDTEKGEYQAFHELASC